MDVGLELGCVGLVWHFQVRPRGLCIIALACAWGLFWWDFVHEGSSYLVVRWYLGGDSLCYVPSDPAPTRPSFVTKIVSFYANWVLESLR